MSKQTEFYTRLMPAIMAMGILTAMMSQPEAFSEFIDVAMGRCRYCHYMRNHPVARHDEVRGECGWR